MNSAQLILSAQRAMLFNVSQKFRMISLEVDENKTLKLLVIISSELTEEEKDLAYSMAGEIVGDFVEIEKSDVDFIVSNDPINSLERLHILMYALDE